MNDELVNAIQTVDTSNLIREADYNTNIAEIEKKFLTIGNILLLQNLII